MFDGDEEIPEVDTPGVVWDDDRLLVVDADGPEILEVDLETGTITTRIIDVTTWLDRLSVFWMPVPSAKGPSLGTFSSAALSINKGLGDAYRSCVASLPDS